MGCVADENFWSGKRVLITGHSGFKGSWLTIWLHRLAARVTGIGLHPTTAPNLFSLAKVDTLCESHFCDLRDRGAIEPLIQAAQPEIVFHLAAQPLVRASYQDPQETFATNVMGTVHVLDALRRLDCVRVAVMVTTDKVYRNMEQAWPYREDDTLGGHDPYSASKAAAEIVIASYRDAFMAQQGVAVASARAGNVIAGGDWAEDRLIPDAVRAWQHNHSLILRRPRATRPWQHVLEPLAGYLCLAQKLWDHPELAGAYNFGPERDDTVSAHELAEMARDAYGKGRIDCREVNDGPYEAGCLALETAKSRVMLGIKPKLKLIKAVGMTMSWYLAQSDGGNAQALCASDISHYETIG